MKYLQLTIRELFLLIALVAMGLGWWNHARRMEKATRQLQHDLATQADFAYSLHHALTKLGCEIPPDSDPRCAAGGPYTRVFVPESLQQPTHCVSFTLTGRRQELQRALDGEFGRFRDVASQ